MLCNLWPWAYFVWMGLGKWWRKPGPQLGVVIGFEAHEVTVEVGTALLHFYTTTPLHHYTTTLLHYSFPQLPQRPRSVLGGVGH